MHLRAHKRTRRALRAIPVAIAAIALPVLLPATMLTSASAAGLLPTTTTLAASPASSVAGTSVTLTATVSVLGLPGLGVTPTGAVTFTDGSTLGSASIASCLLTTCTATLKTSSLPVGSTTVTASYAGDLLSAASSGPAAVTVTNPTPPGTPGNPIITSCPQGGNCDTGTISDPTGDTSIDTDATSTNGVTLTSSVGGSALPCSVPGAGEVANVQESAGGGAKTFTYTLNGASAAALSNWETSGNEGDTNWVCYDSSIEWTGFVPEGYPANPAFPQSSPETGLVYGPVPAYPSSGAPESSTWGGTYAALMPECNPDGSIEGIPTAVPPCYQSLTFTYSGATATKVVFVISAPAGDPHVGGG